MSGADVTDAFLKHGVTAQDFLNQFESLRAAQRSPADAARLARIEDMADEIAEREEAVALHKTRKAAENAAADKRIRVFTGDEFILDIPEELPVIVGTIDEVLMVEGEAMLFVGGDGVGKSTLAQQVALARIGIRSNFLGFPVAPGDGKVLYLAMDRPAQIRRSLRRMVSEAERAVLRERMVAWNGPLPIDPLASASALADWIDKEFGAGVIDMVVADSYKDLAPGLAEDKPGSQLNLAMQEVLSRGIQWVGLHHQRKPASDRTSDYTLADVYGSRWLTAGAGSVFMVLGDAGDSTVELRHLKQPKSVVGPLLVQHDHLAGSTSRIVASQSVETALVADPGSRFTVRELSVALYGEYTDRLRQRIERDLKRLTGDPYSGVHTEPVARGGSGGTTGKTWWYEPVDRVFKVSTSKGREQRSEVSE